MGQNLCLDVMDGLAFRIDRAGIIQDVGANHWDAFAAANGAPELQASTVISRSLFSYIEGEQVRTYLRQVLDRIAEDPNWCWVLPFRCDAPDRERGICQSLRPIFSGQDCTGFLFQSIEQYSRQRPPIHLYNFKTIHQLNSEDPTTPIVQMCSWCQRVKYEPISDDTWINAEDYYAKGGRTNVRLSHGICSRCRKTTADPFQTDASLPQTD